MCFFPKVPEGERKLEVSDKTVFQVNTVNSIYREANLDVTLPWSFSLGSWSCYKQMKLPVSPSNRP